MASILHLLLWKNHWEAHSWSNSCTSLLELGYSRRHEDAQNVLGLLFRLFIMIHVTKTTLMPCLIINSPLETQTQHLPKKRKWPHTIFKPFTGFSMSPQRGQNFSWGSPLLLAKSFHQMLLAVLRLYTTLCTCGLGQAQNPTTNFYTTARDIMFFGHHANVDRMWDIYCSIRGHTPEFKQNDWLEASFIFYDENRQVVKCKVCFIIINLLFFHSFSIYTPKLQKDRKVEDF